ncbi:MAG: hypothetical protein J2P29_05170 [Actinobacteria bacterium]|nr:hypothetical protein [Actinomycetota bacterium]
MIRKPGTVVRAERQQPGYNERLRAERAAGGYAEDLKQARESARGWQAGQLAVLGLISVVGTIKSPQDLQALTAPTRWAAGTAMVLALAMAVAGVVTLGLAGRPLPKLTPRVGPPGPGAAVSAIRQTAWRIRVGLMATVTSVCLLAAAVVTTWLPAAAASPAGLVRLVTTTSTLCGQLAGSNGSTVVLSIGGQLVSIHSRDVVSLAPAKNCG